MRPGGPGGRESKVPVNEAPWWGKLQGVTALWVIAAGWVVIGGGTAIVMARRGHDVTSWAVLGLVLGPLAAAFAIGSARSEADAGPAVLAAGRPGPGSVDVLVGIDGSPEASAALRAAVELHRQHLGRLCLAAVVPFDAEVDPGVTAALQGTAAEVAALAPTTVVLRGEPADALGAHARAEGFEVLVVGARGRGRAAGPLGSVAARLAAGAPVPVLVGPADRGRR